MVFLVLMVWVGGEEGLVVKTEANVEESQLVLVRVTSLIGAALKFDVGEDPPQRRFGLCLVDRVKDRSAEQIVNIPAPRVMEGNPGKICRSHHTSARSWSRLWKVSK